jgi:hypothetical protein
MDWLSFLEALGHVARFKEAPRLADLAADGLDSIAALADALDAKGEGWNDYVAAHPPTVPADPFPVRLKQTLQLLFRAADRPR